MRRIALLIGLASALAACVSPAAQASPQVARADSRFAKCGGEGAPVIAAFPMEAARDYHVHLPKMGLSPELDESAAPAFVVVFEGMWPGAFSGAAPPPGTTWPPRSLAPGSHDVCIWVGDATTGQPTVYADVNVAGMTP